MRRAGLGIPIGVGRRLRGRDSDSMGLDVVGMAVPAALVVVDDDAGRDSRITATSCSVTASRSACQNASGRSLGGVPIIPLSR